MEILTHAYYWMCIPVALIYIVFIRLPRETKVSMVLRSGMVDGLIFFLALWVIIGFFTQWWWMFLILTIVALSPNLRTDEDAHKRVERYRAGALFIVLTVIFILYLKF